MSSGSPPFDLALVSPLILELTLVALLAAGVSRLLRVRLPKLALAAGVLLTLALVAPWLRVGALMVPTSPLHQIPGVPRLDATSRFDTLNDAVLQFLPWEAEVRHAFARRELPLWSDHLGGGGSLWPNPQAMILSPLAWLSRMFPLQHFLLGMLAGKLLLAAAGAWTLAARLGIRPLGRGIAAVSFALGGSVAGWGLFPLSSSMAWVPWLAAAAIAVVRDRGPAPFAGAALVTAALALAGHPETALLGGLGSTVLALALARPGDRRVIRACRAAGAAGLGLMLAAPLLVPFLLEAPRSARWLEMSRHGFPHDSRGTQFGFDAGTRAFLDSPLHPRPFGRAFREPFRGPYGWTESGSAYAGLVVLAGTALALWMAGRRRLAPILLLTGGALLFGARFRLVEDAVALLPGLDTIAPVRALPLVSLGLALAGGAGWAAFARRRRPSLPALATLGLMAAASFAAGGPAGATASWSLIGLAALGLGLGLRPALGAGLLCLALAFDLPGFARDRAPVGAVAQLFPRTPFLDEVADRVADDPGRISGFESEVYPAILPFYGFEEIRPHDPLASESRLALLDACCGFRPTMSNYFGRLENPASPFLEFLGLRWAIAPPGRALPAPWEPTTTRAGTGHTLWRNPGARPRWFFPARLEIDDLGRIPQRVASLERSDTVLLPSGTPDLASLSTADPDTSSVRELERLPGRARLEITTRSPALVATSLPGPEGWRVESGNARLPVVAAHGAYLAFVAPAGTSEVILTYRPPGFALGWILAALGSVLCGLALARERISRPSWRRRRAPASRPR